MYNNRKEGSYKYTNILEVKHMIRKIYGVLLLVFAAFLTYSVVYTALLMNDVGYDNPGYLLGMGLPVVAYLFSGIFLIRFDSVYKKSYVEGFKARRKQCTLIVVYIVVFFVFAFLGGKSMFDSIFNLILWAVLYFVPGMFFAIMLAFYAVPYWNCNKKFSYIENALNTYLTPEEAFKSYSEDNFVLANSKVLFLPKIFCVIPLDQIASVKFVNIIVEKDVYFHLTNGKKIEIVADQKKYESIKAAFEANRQ